MSEDICRLKENGELGNSSPLPRHPGDLHSRGPKLPRREVGGEEVVLSRKWCIVTGSRGLSYTFFGVFARVKSAHKTPKWGSKSASSRAELTRGKPYYREIVLSTNWLPTTTSVSFWRGSMIYLGREGGKTKYNWLLGSASNASATAQPKSRRTEVVPNPQ